MPNQHAGAFRIVWAALLAANFCIHSHAARAEGVNFDLLIDSLKARANPARVHRPEAPPAAQGPRAFAPPARKLKPIEELTEYVQCLKETRCRFAPSKTGEEAALDLGYSRLFASAYEEVRQHVKTRQRDGKAGSDDVVPDFAAIAGEEQAIDKLLSAKERHAAAIAYLRALQNGDVAFPDPRTTSPPPQLLLIQLTSAYPNIAFDINDQIFAEVYRATRYLVEDRATQTNELEVHAILGDFRKLILRSASTREDDATSTMCKQATIAGQLVGIVHTCRGVRATDSEEKAAEMLTRRAESLDCLNDSMAKIKRELSTLTDDEVSSFCGSIENRVRSSQIGGLLLVRQAR